MSPRAAARLESMGCTQVFDYVPGKQAWYEENELREGKATDEIWIGDVADGNIPTCGLKERIGELRDRVRADGRDTCVVINPQGIVLGLLKKSALEASPSRPPRRSWCRARRLSGRTSRCRSSSNRCAITIFKRTTL